MWLSPKSIWGAWIFTDGQGMRHDYAVLFISMLKIWSVLPARNGYKIKKTRVLDMYEIILSKKQKRGKPIKKVAKGLYIRCD